jgi:hypothetical protein
LSFHRAGRIPIKEFSRMIQDFSENGGDFPTDNLTSNERNYLQVSGKLKELGVSGGAYIGVGPEQNFSYIAKIRPRIAFIVDIRRQAIIQHLMYKALFHLAKNRAQFLSLLFSKPVPKARYDTDGSFDPLLDYIAAAPTTQETFEANFNRIRKTIEVDFQFPLTPEDIRGLLHIFNYFWHDNLTVGFRFGKAGKVPGPWGFPDLRELLLATDLDGNRGNFLATEESYQFVRKLQEQNRVIPVNGDFAGVKALASVARYLRKNGYTVSAFYTSNVEEYLYENRVFGRFAENVRQLPVSDHSVFIRAVRSGWYPHSFWALAEHITPFLQKIPDFLADYQAGILPDYWSLVTTHPIPAAESLRQFLPKPAPRPPSNGSM